MRIIRWAAVAITVLMSLMNLGAALGSGDDKLSVPVVVAIAVLTVAGFAAAIGLAMHTTWGRPAVLAVGALNLLAAIIALFNGGEGAVIGLVVSALILLLGGLSTDSGLGRRTTGTATSIG